MLLKEQRELVVEYGKRLVEAELTVGTFGNLSVYDREQDLMAISPSGMDYFATDPEDVVVLTLQGRQVEGTRQPSIEADLHCLLYQNREDVNAVIHPHSTYTTVLACLHWPIPPSIIWSPTRAGRSPVFPTIPLDPWSWPRLPGTP